MIDLLNPPERPKITEAELRLIRSTQETELWKLVDAYGLQGGLEAAAARFHKDIPPMEHLLPSENPGGWYLDLSDAQLALVDEMVRNSRRHYFEEPKASGMRDPTLYGVSQLKMDVTAKWLTDLGQMKGDIPLVASLARGDIGAYIRPSVETGRNIMFYPAGLYLYQGDLAKAVAHLFYPIDLARARNETSFAEAVRLVPHLRGHAMLLSQALTSVAAEDHPILAPRIQVARSQKFIAINLFSMSQMFVFAHEIAHQVLGHMDERDDGPTRRIEMEFEADRFAMEVVCAYTEKHLGSWALGYWGCQLGLIGFELLNRALLILDGRSPESAWQSAEYPSPTARRLAIEKAAAAVASDAAYAAAAHATNALIQTLNRHARDIDLQHFSIRSVLQRGPSVIWKSYILQNFGPKEEDRVREGV